MELEDREAESRAKSFSATLRSWRYFVWFLILVGLIAAFYTEENWRGRRALENYQRELLGRGQNVAASAFVPEPVADSQNFALTPLLAPLYDFLPGTQKWRDANAVQRAQGIAPIYDTARRGMKEGKEARTNSWVKAPGYLIAWHKALLQARDQIEAKTNSPSGVTATSNLALSRAENGGRGSHANSTEPAIQEAATGILMALSECDSEIEELRADSRRPFSRFNLRYEEDNPAAILLPHLSVLKRLTEILHLRAAAELILGRTEEAFNDVKLMLYLTNASQQEPIFISQLVRMAQMQLCLEDIAYGMNRWSETQLRDLQVRLRQFNFCADIKRALEGERALFGGGVIDFIHRSPEKYNELGPNESALPTVLLRAMPGGWFDFEKANYFRTFEDFMGTIASDLDHRRINPENVKHTEEQFGAILAKPTHTLWLKHRLFARVLLPSMANAFRKTAFVQTGVDAACLACALERHRRAQGEFPKALEALIPQFVEKLPADIITGQPLHYSRLAGGQYVVYSVGWSEKDNGGTLATGKQESYLPIEGDWVWRAD